MPQQWKDAIIWVLQKEGSDRVRQLQGHLAGSAQILLKIIDRRLSEYCERVGIWLEERRPNRSITAMVFEFCRLQELARKKRIPLYVCFINLTIAYDSVDRTLLWTVLARFGVPHNIISVVRQFHDGMRACARLVCSG